MYIVNECLAKTTAEKGYAEYPDDFPHLKDGEDFTAWKSGGCWHIETTLDADMLHQRLIKEMCQFDESISLQEDESCQEEIMGGMQL